MTPHLTRFGAGVRYLPSSYFAMVMATGVSAMAADEFGIPVLPAALTVLNVVAYAVLWLLTIVRALRYRRELTSDLTDHVQAPGFFTVVAATGVLGSQVLVLWQAWTAAQVLWLVTLALWLVLTYTVFTALTTRETKPALADGITGGWLLSVVATQAVVVLGMSIAPAVPPRSSYRCSSSLFLSGCGAAFCTS